MHVFVAFILNNDGTFHDFLLGEMKLPKSYNILLFVVVCKP